MRNQRVSSRILRQIEFLDLGPFKGHLEELRTRLIKSLVLFCVVFVMAYFFSEEIMRVLLMPLTSTFLNQGKGLVYTALTEGFFAYLKVAFWTALFFIAPFFVHEIWAFVAPGLYAHEKVFLRRIILWGGGLFFAGALFGFFVLFPAILSFSLGIAAQGLIPMPRIGHYVVLVVKFAFFTGLLFEVPFTMALAIKAGMVKRETLINKRKYFLIGLYALCAFLVPTDIFSQVLLFIPLWGLFEIGLRTSAILRVKRE